MLYSVFTKVIVIGYGVIAKDVLETVFKKKERYKYDLIYVEHEVYPFNLAQKFADSNGIESQTCEDKSALLEFFKNKTKDGATLIISASSNYIFPGELTEDINATIVNFHNALLPNYPGRNAPSWVIYNDEKETGITWHYVSNSIDAGDIIIQKKIPIESNVKAYELAAQLMGLASEAFDEFIDDVLSGQRTGIPQQVAGDRRVYKSYEVPGDGHFNLDDSPQEIYKLLRAIDYGKNNIFPLAKSELNGQEICIKRYKITDSKEAQIGEKKLYLPIEDNFLQLRYETC